MCHEVALKESPAVLTLRHVVTTEDAQFFDNTRPTQYVSGVSLFNFEAPQNLRRLEITLYHFKYFLIAFTFFSLKGGNASLSLIRVERRSTLRRCVKARKPYSP